VNVAGGGEVTVVWAKALGAKKAKVETSAVRTETAVR
jgi:hypothetical protein